MNIVRDKILALENAMREQPQADIKAEYSFSDGMCARTISLKAGSIITGAIHLQDQLNIASGDITVITENSCQRYVGYNVIPSNAGVKRVGFMNADTSWTTILRTDEKDPEKIESMLTTNSFDDPRLPCNKILELEG